MINEILAPYKHATLGPMFEQVVRQFPRNLAFLYEGQQITYEKFGRLVDRVEQGLWRVGVRKGQHIALMMHNSPEWLAVFIAAGRIGAISVAINTRLEPSGLEYVLRQSDSTILFIAEQPGDRRCMESLLEICPELQTGQRLETAAFPMLQRAVVLGDRRWPWALSWQQLVEGNGSDAAAILKARALVTSEDLLVIQYTSGTTAIPKGVMATHGQILHNSKKFATHLGIAPDDRHATAMPFFHNGGLVAGALCTMINGGCLVLHSTFQAEKMLQSLEEHRCTIFSGVDTMFIMMMNAENFTKYDISCVRTGWTTGNEIVRIIAERMGIRGILGLYGISEASPNVCLQLPDQPLEYRAIYAGKPHDGVEICIKDPETGALLSSGLPGEICLRGFSITKGYYNRPEETAKAFDADGWFYTGDLGRLSSEGDLRFEGRFKEIVRVGGENVASIEIEDCLLTHPKVKRAFVVPAPHPTLIEVPAAYVELVSGAGCSAEELVEYVSQRMARYKVPRLIRFVQESDLPMTASGKVQKVRLKERAQTDFVR